MAFANNWVKLFLCLVAFLSNSHAFFPIRREGKHSSRIMYGGRNYKHIIVKEAARENSDQCFNLIEGFHVITTTGNSFSNQNFDDCLTKCMILPRTVCMGFSYSYNQRICDLKIVGDPLDIPVMINDISFKYYERTECENNNNRANARPEECLYIVKNNHRLPSFLIEDRKYADNLNICRQFCMNKASCEIFSYNREDIGSKYFNCFLSAKTLEELLMSDLIPDHNAVTYSVKCQSDNSIDELKCFMKSRSNSRADKHIRGSFFVENLSKCEEKCLSINSPYTCRAFNYKPAKMWFFQSTNCQLIDADWLPRNSGDHFSYDEDYSFYERTSYSGRCNGNKRDSIGQRRDGYCFTKFKNFKSLSHEVIGQRKNVPSLSECERACLHTMSCRTIAFGMIDNTRNIGECLLSTYIANSLKDSDFIENSNFDIYRLDSKCKKDHSSQGRNDDGGQWTTVNGHQCYSWPCSRSLIMGFYYCEIDAYQNWDYCCQPGEACSSSRNM